VEITSLTIRRGKVVGIKGPRNRAIDIITKSIGNTKRAHIEIIGDPPTENIPQIINSLSILPDYYLLLEPYDRDIGFYFLFKSKRGVIFIDRRFLRKSNTVKMLRSIAKRLDGNSYIQINLLDVSAIGPLLSLLEDKNVTLEHKRLQLDSEVAKYLLENREILSTFNSVKVFASNRNTIVVDRELGYIRIYKPKNTRNTIILGDAIKLSKHIPVITLEIDNSESMGALRKLIMMIAKTKLHSVKNIIISRSQILLGRDQFCIAIEIESFNDDLLLDALHRGDRSLNLGRSEHIIVS